MRQSVMMMAVGVAGILVGACSSDDASTLASGGNAAQERSSSATGTGGSSGSSSGDGTSTGAGDWDQGPGSAGAGGTTGGSDGGFGAEPPAAPPVSPSDPTGTNEGDKYEAVGTNPFTLTSADPQSTFAADVDDASYKIFLRDVLNFGMLPNPAGVRLEEWVNYFEYDYEIPAIDDAVPFAISLQAAPSPFVPGTTVARVGIQGRPLDQLEERDANIVFLVDASGSMGAATKMPFVKKALTAALDVLQPTDKVAIVTYAGGAGLALASTPVSNKSAIAKAINALSTGGGTNGAGGIHAAYAQAEGGWIEGGINHVVMCTDGDFNVGVSGTDALVDLIIEKRETGITFTALGFGSGNLNDIMMEKVSNAGNGTYSVIIDDDDAVNYANTKFLSSLYFIAKDMKIQVEFNPEEVHAYRLIGYEINDIPDELFTDDTVDAGEIGAGHRVTALYELVMVGDEVPMFEGAPDVEGEGTFDGELGVESGQLLRVAVRYKQPGEGEQDAAAEVDASLSVEAVLSDLDDADDDFRWAAAVAAFAEILKGSPYGDPSNLEAIKSIIDQDPQATWSREEFVMAFDAAVALLQQ